jgi:hypothetical protein
VWLDHPKADVDSLQDLLWATCEETTWVAPAHEEMAVDLFACGTGIQLAETLAVLGEQLEDEVADRIRREIACRVLEPAADPTQPMFWHTARMNWNHVCNGLIVEIALCLMDNPAPLAQTIHGPIQRMTYAIDGFTDDGGCVEGAGYWNYGFGHFVRAAFALHQRTEGELDIMTDEKVRRICRYPLAGAIAPPLRAAFADGDHGYIAADVALKINRFDGMPDLRSCCRRNSDNTLELTTWHELALGDGRKAPVFSNDRDEVLPDLEEVKLVARPGRRQLTLAAKAGHNGVPHNHNDVGSFLVIRGDRELLTDPGAPVYTRDTFNEHRYEFDLINSRGHSVPVINGRLQAEGGEHAGSLDVDGLNADTPKTAVIDMTRAYPAGTIRRLVRTFRLDPQANEIAMEDVFEFERKPSSLEEAFITRQRVRLLAGGRAVQIGPDQGGLKLQADETRGRFHRTVMLAATATSHSPNEPITRITFVPETLTHQMRLRFVMR